MGTTFSRSVANSLESRETQLFDNELFRAAIFLDPRFKVFLSDEDKVKAKDTLKTTWENMRRLKISENESEPGPQEQISTTVPKANEDELDVIIREKERLRPTQQEVRQSTVRNEISISLDSFDNVPLLNKSANVLQWWESMKTHKNDLYELSQVVLAVPMTQVSVERSFSGLKFILSPYRSNISSALLGDVLLVRANSQFNQ